MGFIDKLKGLQKQSLLSVKKAIAPLISYQNCYGYYTYYSFFFNVLFTTVFSRSQVSLGNSVMNFIACS